MRAGTRTNRNGFKTLNLYEFYGIAVVEWLSG